jgi:uncharacterized protein (TIGR03437 family)
MSGQTYSVSTVAGQTWVVEGRQATAAPLRAISAIAQDSTGNIYVGLKADHRVIRIGADGTVAIVAGTGEPGVSGDGGPAVRATLDWPGTLRLDAKGGLYIADRSATVIRKVDLATGIITKVAGIPYRSAFSGDGGPASQAGVDPYDLALDVAGNIYIADLSNSRIRKVSTAGVISTIAGNGKQPITTVDAPVDSVSVPCPYAIGITGAGVLYFLQCSQLLPLVKLDLATGIIKRVPVDIPGNVFTRMAVAPNGDAWITTDNSLTKFTEDTGKVSRIAGTGSRGFAGDGGALSAVVFSLPSAITVAPNADVLIGDTMNTRIRRLRGSVITTIAGRDGNSGGPAVAGFLDHPRDVLADGPASFLITDSGNSAVKRVSGGVIATVFTYFNCITAMAKDGKGDIYFAEGTSSDLSNCMPLASRFANPTQIPFPFADILKYDTAGKISTFAGRFGSFAQPGDDGPASNARIYNPQGLAIDTAGNVYIADQVWIRAVGTDGIIRRIAGSNVFNAVGENIPALQSGIVAQGMAVDRGGNLLVADPINHVIRKLDLATNLVSTAAGIIGRPGFSGDGGAPTGATLNRPTGVAVDTTGNMYIADYGNARVRVIRGNIINTIAGNGNGGYDVDSGLALQVSMSPYALAASLDGSVYISDYANERIRKLTPEPNAPACGLSSPNIKSVSLAGDYGGGFTFSSGSWLEIKGSNLAPTELIWAASDFTGSIAPQTLAGSMVSINGRRGFVYYVSPTQMNVQAPSDPYLGQVAITVSHGAGTSNVAAMTKSARTPGMLAPAAFKVGGRQYLTAQFPDGFYVGAAGLIPGVAFRPAKPGDTITAYGVGFGDVIPSVPAGSVASGETALPGVVIRFGGTSAVTSYAGLAPGNVGLYQFNIVVPDVPDGDHLIEIEAGGTKVPQLLYLTVRRNSRVAGDVMQP